MAKKAAEQGKKTRSVKSKKKVGRPSGYRDEYCDLMKKYFMTPKRKTLYDTEYFSNGTMKKKKPIMFPPEFPTFEEFAHKIGVAVSTVYEWEKAHVPFADACEFAREEQKRHLITFGLSRVFDGGFARFLLLAKYPTEFKDGAEPNEPQKLVIDVTYGKNSVNEEKKT